MAEEEIEGADTLWRTTALHMTKLEQYRRSLPFYDKAVKQCPKDKKTLIDRAKARCQTNQFNGALEDIKEALRIDSHDIIALTAKAHSTYMSCEIEQAMIQNYRLLPRRKKPDNFKLGIMQCVSALHHSLGDICGRPLRDHFLIIRREAWLKHMKGGDKDEFVPRRKLTKKGSVQARSLTLHHKLKQLDKNPIADVDPALAIKDSLHSHQSETYLIPRLSTPFKFNPLQRFTSNIENYMSEKYLDRMYREKLFLKQMVSQEGLITSNVKGSKAVKEIAVDCYKVVAQKQEVLRTRVPFYYLKFQEAKVSGTLKLRQDAELQLQQTNTKKEADKIAKKLEAVTEAHDVGGAIDMVEKLKAFIDSKSKRLLPDKERYMEIIYYCIRKAFFEVHRLNEDQVKWDQDKRILVALDQPISREPSNDSIIDYYKNYNLKVDCHAQVRLFEHRVKEADNDDELCWCYHELARYHMFLKHFDHAKVNATNCIYTAQAYDQKEWIVNGLILLIRTHIRLKSKAEALEEAGNVLTLAHQLKNKGLIQYIQRVIRVINDLEFDLSPLKKIEKRQKKILALMTSPKLKEEFAHLFRSMKNLPRERRISIIPGMPKANVVISERNLAKKAEGSEMEPGPSGTVGFAT